MNKHSSTFSSLTHEVLWYQLTGEGFPGIRDKIIIIAYTAPRKYMRGYRECASEFCIRFVPKIHKIVSSFTYCGRSFETYLSRVLFVQVQTFLRERYNENHRMNVIIHHYTYHKKNCSHWGEARETPPESYCSTIPKGLTPQRLLILALVKAFSVPPELYEEVARLTGHPLNQIIRMFKEVHMREKKKFTRFRTLQEFRNRYYCEMISLQYQIEQCIDSDEKQQLESRLSRTNELLENARNRLNSYNLRVSHQTVAEVLGIPKGTVDSSMFYIKRRSFEPSVDLG